MLTCEKWVSLAKKNPNSRRRKIVVCEKFEELFCRYLNWILLLRVMFKLIGKKWQEILSIHDNPVQKNVVKTILRFQERFLEDNVVKLWCNQEWWIAQRFEYQFKLISLLRYFKTFDNMKNKQKKKWWKIEFCPQNYSVFLKWKVFRC